MVGLSRQLHDLSRTLFEELCRRGYGVVPVNPSAAEIQGGPCFAHVQDIQPPVDAALLITSPTATETVVRDCAEAGITRVWMYRGRSVRWSNAPLCLWSLVQLSSTKADISVIGPPKTDTH